MTILVFGIHPDDIELACGGTVVCAVGAGHAVTLVDLSDGRASSNGTPQIRAREAHEAAQILGVDERRNLGLPDAGIRSENPEQLRRVILALRDIRPDLVLLPSADDPHPDHASGARLIERALYLSRIHGYEPQVPAWAVRRAMWYPGRRHTAADVVVDVTRVYDQKRAAILAHESQFGGGSGRKPTPLNAPDFLQAVEARDRVYGQQVGARFGEPFRFLYPVCVEDLGTLFGDVDGQS